MTSGDNSNILTARIARETYEIPNVVARIYDPRRAQIYLRLGIPTVATVSWTIDQVRRRLVPGQWSRSGPTRPGTLSLVERELPERWAGKRLADLSRPGEVTVVAVTRAGVARLDFDDLVGQDGDVLHLMVTDTALDRLAPGSSGGRRPPTEGRPTPPAGSAHGGTQERGRREGGHRRGGKRGDGHRLRPPRRRATTCCSSSRTPTWWPGSAATSTSPGWWPTPARSSSLDAAGLSTVDVVVAATGDDEDNLVVSLLAKQEFAVPRVVARVNHPKNQWLFNESWGVDVSVSTPQLLTALVEEAVSVGSLVRLLRFEGGNAHLVEVTLADDSPAAGVTLVDLGVPRDATVVAVVRDDRLIVPRGDTRLAIGDEVLVLVTRRRRGVVQQLLVGPLTGAGRLLRSGQDGDRQGLHRRLRPPLYRGG